MREANKFDIFLLVLLGLIWGSSFFNIKIATYSYGPLTIAFLTYGKNLSEQVKMARAAGHEILVHIAMEPLNKALTLGLTFYLHARHQKQF